MCIEDIRRVLADYMDSEGCDCCEDDSHSEHRRLLAELVGVPFEIGAGDYDIREAFLKFHTKDGN